MVSPLERYSNILKVTQQSGIAESMTLAQAISCSLDSAAKCMMFLKGLITYSIYS